MTALPPRFRPAPYTALGAPRVDDPAWIEHVIAVVSLPPATAGGPRRDLVVGVDAGHVIRAVPMTEARRLPARASGELELHAQQGEALQLTTDELYLFDLQIVENVPDVPGADDPMYLYGVIRGPYPAALEAGVSGVEGQLATTRGGVLRGFQLGVPRAFRYAPSAYGSRCVPILLAGAARGDGATATPGIVLAFPLAPPLGGEQEIANDLVAAQLAHDVIGATRRDLGDDLGVDPVPVPSRQAYERELVAGGWTIAGDVAKRKTKGRFGSLFTPAATQRLPPEATLPEYCALVGPLLKRLGPPSLDQVALQGRVRDVNPAPVAPSRLGTAPAPPRSAPSLPVPQRASSPRPLPPPPPAPPPPLQAHRHASEFSDWIEDMFRERDAQPRERARLAQPSRVHGTTRARLPDWIFDSSDTVPPKRKP